MHTNRRIDTEDSKNRLENRNDYGYDHGYYFISTFIEEHLRFHAGQNA